MKSDIFLKSQKAQLLASVGEKNVLIQLFDQLSDTTFFLKNADSVLLAGSRTFYERLGFHREDQMIGKSDFELFPTHMAEHFRRDDLSVIRSGQPKLNIVELFFNRFGIPDWYVTNKFPVFDENRHVIGVIGTTRSYTGAKENLKPYLLIDRAVEIIRSSFRQKLNVAELAEIVGLSERQFLRRFKQAFSCSPQVFILKTRMSAACDRLSQSDDKISQIAHDCGFADGSSFVQLFRREIGETPLHYRKRYRLSESSC
ncbi:MAG: helix-turn-helix domain-containing protein [Akkermansiaceae bacterium]